MRNWNCFTATLWKTILSFSAYLWGIETDNTPAGVLRVVGSQPTYEELKPDDKDMLKMALQVLSLPMRNWNPVPFHGFRCDYPVLSLPMRNWNAFPRLKKAANNRFSAYLWGIETKAFQGFPERRLRVLSLPMRNWNRLKGKKQPDVIISSQPTYEELKHDKVIYQHLPLNGSQPTYEELKQFKPRKRHAPN